VTECCWAASLKSIGSKQERKQVDASTVRWEFPKKMKEITMFKKGTDTEMGVIFDEIELE
jgi:hypothetical protein